MRLRPAGRAEVDLADGAVVRIDYDTAPLVGRQMGQSEQRSHIPALAIDLDRDVDVAVRVAGVETGTATSSRDFDALRLDDALGRRVASLPADVPPTGCMRLPEMQLNLFCFPP